MVITLHEGFTIKKILPGVAVDGAGAGSVIIGPKAMVVVADVVVRCSK